MSVMIETRGVTQYHGVFVAVQNISFHIPAHQVVALLGPNGAGKTTLLRILTGYLTPSAGTAWIAGLDVQRARRATAARVGYLPENGPLYLDMTPLEIAPVLWGSTRPRRCQAERAHRHGHSTMQSSAGRGQADR